MKTVYGITALVSFIGFVVGLITHDFSYAAASFSACLAWALLTLEKA